MEASSMERVDALWFPDGNIVLSAHGVLFRVFKGILAARSPVFAEMLRQDGADAAEMEMMDGCPVLHLDDSPADAMYFLKALFDYEFFAPYPARTDFDAIHGVLRLGTKYRVAPLRRRALQHLSSAHPTGLGAWDVLCEGASASALASTMPSASAAGSASMASASGSGSVSASTTYGQLSHPQTPLLAHLGPSFDPAHLELPILTLARAARAAWVLPTAFLRAAAALTAGTLTSLDVLEGIDYTGVHVELERADKVTLLEAGGALLGEGTSELLGFLWSPTVCPGCVHALPPSSPSPSASSSSPSPSTSTSNTASTSTTSLASTATAVNAGASAGGVNGVMNPCTANRLAMRVAAEPPPRAVWAAGLGGARKEAGGGDGVLTCACA
ncbi:hypothetical protein DFH06DRAFT_1138 [Mycena polygramma]|nr:hypothetical protein DFH06DRAFT_1138 [Mycena polygramma]